MNEDVEQFLLELDHSGVKGMKWGVRQTRKELRAAGKNADKIRGEFDRSTSNSQRKAAADRYEKEVLGVIRSKDFKQKYRTANTMTKGDMVAHILIAGPFAAMTIPQAKRQMSDLALIGPSMEEAAARRILREMRSA